MWIDLEIKVLLGRKMNKQDLVFHTKWCTLAKGQHVGCTPKCRDKKKKDCTQAKGLKLKLWLIDFFYIFQWKHKDQWSSVCPVSGS